MTVSVVALALFSNGRVHSLFSDESSLIIQEGVHLATHYSPAMDVYRFSLPNAPHGSLIRAKVTLTLEILNNYIPNYLYIPGLDTMHKVSLDAPITRVTFPLDQRVSREEGGYVVKSTCGRVSVRVGVGLQMIQVEYLQSIGRDRHKYTHL